MTAHAQYIGRFAPSPTGALHAGSLAAALASYLDARAHGGHWLLRIEDIDRPRETSGAAQLIIEQLTAYGMRPDKPISWQHQHADRYAQALAALHEKKLAYRCYCSRNDIRHRRLAAGLKPIAAGEELAYDGFCRERDVTDQQAHSWRLDTRAPPIEWHERYNTQTHHEIVEQLCGDFVIRRRDSLWSYQLAVVVDDAAQGVTHVVRGDDLSSNTARQCLLQTRLSLPRPSYLHLPVVRDASGVKLSKQAFAPAVTTPINDADLRNRLNRSMQHIGLAKVTTDTMETFWSEAISRWAGRYLP